MSEITMSQAVDVSTDGVGRSRASLSASLALVVGFWWAATGVTLAMQRSEFTSTASVITATVFAMVGCLLIVNSRSETTVRSARLAFLGSALVWWWCSTLFYAGVGIQIADNIPTGPRTLALAFQAIEATVRPDLLGVFALILLAALVWRKPNSTAFWTLLVFFGSLQTAKLNVFMGVRNSGVDWLPEHLVGLSQFFGPPQNSALLPVTIAGLAACFLVTAVMSRAATGAFRKHMLAMLSFLLGLALLEHVFLGVNLTLPLWDIFKPLR
ncbi:MAG: DUF3623 family protein [Gemmatimonadaceae bacterium]